MRSNSIHGVIKSLSTELACSSSSIYIVRIHMCGAKQKIEDWTRYIKAIEVEIRKNFMILSNHFLSKLRNDAFYYRSEDWKRDCTDFCFPKRDPCPRKTSKRSTDIQIFETFLCNLQSVDNPNSVFYLDRNCGSGVNGLWLKTYSFSAASLQCFVIVETSINDGVSCAQTTAWHSRLIRSDKIASTVKKISGNDHAVIYIVNPDVYLRRPNFGFVLIVINERTICNDDR
ncbi:uncharacterized protein LOC126917084 isoform X1 [Bombus affinis]|uniref:uncharacterized protein LOC126917084 isoform X1 n=1 Tax=Bombus affinis TaxID=309941 RepID=UPI0021B7A1E5|nr:uncharacterized protein LOC126917084 isoform X1 [Bombus affinis]